MPIPRVLQAKECDFVLRTIGALGGAGKATSVPTWLLNQESFSFGRVGGGNNLDFDLEPTGMPCESTNGLSL